MEDRAKVTVIGSGGAGLAAALSAAVRGLEVTVLEAADGVGGTTSYSGGVSWIPGTRWATLEGGPDSAEDGLAYVLAMGLGDIDEELVRTYVTEGPDVIDAIAEHSAIEFQGVPFLLDYHAELPHGNAYRGVEMKPLRVPREVLAMLRDDPYDTWPATLTEAYHNEPGELELARRAAEGIVAQGHGFIAGLLAALVERGVVVRTGVRARKLLTDDGGAVVGVEAQGGERFAGQVIVASGGFEWNQDLVRKFLRGPLEAPGSPPTNRGDGLVMGMTVGADLGNMSEAWWAPAMQVPGEIVAGEQFSRIVFTDSGRPGGILVDARGRRFMNEAVNYSCFGRSMQGFDGSTYSFPGAGAWLVFDARRRAGSPLGNESGWTLNPEAQEIIARDISSEPDWLIRRDTIEEVADAIGVAPDTLRATVDRFNEMAERDHDEDFGRGSHPYDLWVSGGAPLTPVAIPPFYALRVLTGCLGTKGGLKTDDRGRVLRAGSGDVVEGLYAAGNAAANPFGYAYPGPGATIGPGIVFGWLAGAAAYARSPGAVDSVV